MLGICSKISRRCDATCQAEGLVWWRGSRGEAVNIPSLHADEHPSAHALMASCPSPSSHLQTLAPLPGPAKQNFGLRRTISAWRKTSKHSCKNKPLRTTVTSEDRTTRPSQKLFCRAAAPAVGGRSAVGLEPEAGQSKLEVGGFEVEVSHTAQRTVLYM